LLRLSHLVVLTPLLGHSVVEVKLIFRPHWLGVYSDVLDTNFPYLAYCERFDIVPQVVLQGRPANKVADPVTGMYVVKRAVRADKSPVGDIIPLSRLRIPVQLIPCFGDKANRKLTSKNSSKYTSQFYLNKYSDKEVFQTVF